MFKEIILFIGVIAGSFLATGVVVVLFSLLERWLDKKYGDDHEVG